MKTGTIKPFAVVLLLAGAASALAGVRYVYVNSTNATPPYTNWATAATDIRYAVGVATAGDEIVVTNGTYNPVGVGLAKQPLSIRSVNGPQFSFISGGGRNRCAYLTNGTGSATLSGFTIRDGYADRGGGAYGGTLNNCILIGNQAINPNPYSGDARGGAAYQCPLNNCILYNNSAVNAFLLTGGGLGGGAYDSTLNNCTLIGNDANGSGGGTTGCTRTNCILYNNTGGYNFVDNYFGGTLNYCCTTPQPAGGVGNIATAPLFDGNLHLQSNSPCINAGNNSYLTNATDLDGNPRIAGGTVDIGAYEFRSPVSMISYAWLQQYGLPINSLTDTADPDGDGVNNYHEWLAGTDPTNPFSSPAQLTIIPSGVPPGGIILTWSTNAVGFTLQSTTNLGSPAAWVSNSPSPVVVNGRNTVTNPSSGLRQFYRLIH